MLISTRTPEGEPFTCRVCGQEHFVLVSRPPGDSVCPSCGSHAWVTSKVTEDLFPPPQVLRQIPLWVDQLRTSHSQSAWVIHLVDGLAQTISPRGVVLSMASDVEDVDQPALWKIVAERGESFPRDFSESIRIQDRDLMQVTTTDQGERLVMGIALRRSASQPRCGILQVSLLPHGSIDQRESRFRFVRSMAAIAAGCPAFLTK